MSDGPGIPTSEQMVSVQQPGEAPKPLKLPGGEGLFKRLVGEDVMVKAGLVPDGRQFGGVGGFVESVGRFLADETHLSEQRDFRSRVTPEILQEARSRVDEIDALGRRHMEAAHRLRIEWGDADDVDKNDPKSERIGELTNEHQDALRQRVERLSGGDEGVGEIIKLAATLEDELANRDAETQEALLAMGQEWLTLPEDEKRLVENFYRETREAGVEFFAAVREESDAADRLKDADTLAQIAPDIDAESSDQRPPLKGWGPTKVLRAVRDFIKHPIRETFMPFASRKAVATELEATLKMRILADNAGDAGKLVSLLRRGIVTVSDLSQSEINVIGRDRISRYAGVREASTVKKAEYYQKHFGAAQQALLEKVHTSGERYFKGAVDQVAHGVVGPEWATKWARVLVGKEIKTAILDVKNVAGHLEFGLTTVEQGLVREKMENLTLMTVLRERTSAAYANESDNMTLAHDLRAAEKMHQRAVIEVGSMVDKMGHRAGLHQRLGGIVSEGWMKAFGGYLSGYGGVEASAVHALRERNARVMSIGHLERAVDMDRVNPEISERVRESFREYYRQAELPDRFRTRADMEGFYRQNILTAVGEGWQDRGLLGGLQEGRRALMGDVLGAWHWMVGARAGARDGGLWDLLTFGSRAETFDRVGGIDSIGRVIPGGAAERVIRDSQVAFDLTNEVMRGNRSIDTTLQLSAARLTASARRANMQQEVGQMKKRERMDRDVQTVMESVAVGGAAMGFMYVANMIEASMGLRAGELSQQIQQAANHIAAETAKIKEWAQVAAAPDEMKKYSIDHANEFINQSKGTIQYLTEGAFAPGDVFLGLRGTELVRGISYGVAATANLAAIGAGLNTIVRGLGTKFRSARIN